MLSSRIGRTLLKVIIPASLICTLLLIAQQNGAWNSIRQRNNSYTQNYHPKPNQNGTRENAAFVVLVRNDDLHAMRETMQQLEDRFNHRYNYPWIFLNNDPFDEKFKTFTSGLASGDTYYGTFNQTMWGYPDWIDQDKARAARDDMAARQIIYGGSESYRHMCRYTIITIIIIIHGKKKEGENL